MGQALDSVAAIVLAAAALVGCSSVAAAEEGDPDLAVQGGTGLQFDEPDIEESFARVSQLRLPAKVAVYGLERNRLGLYADAKVVQFERALGSDPERISEILPLPDFLVGSGFFGDVQRLRSAAARAHADALLVYEQKVETEEKRSPLVVLNLTIVGAWICPSVSYAVHLRTTAALVDVRNGHLYFTAHDARSRDGFCPSALVASRAKAAKAALREEAFATVAASLKAKLARMQDPVPEAPK